MVPQFVVCSFVSEVQCHQTKIPFTYVFDYGGNNTYIDEVTLLWVGKSMVKNSKNVRSGKVVLKFRNYKPQSEIPEATIMFKGNNYENVEAKDIENEIDLSEPYRQGENIRLAPSEMNGDLKKGLESKLRELEERTKLAIFELLTQEVSQRNNVV